MIDNLPSDRIKARDIDVKFKGTESVWLLLASRVRGKDQGVAKEKSPDARAIA